MTHHNKTKWPWHRQSRLRWSILATIVALGGCAGLVPSSNNAGGGINLDYLFGARRPAGQADTLLVDDPEYADYLEWKRWQDFQAYQEWKRLRDEEGTSGDSASN